MNVVQKALLVCVKFNHRPSAPPHWGPWSSPSTFLHYKNPALPRRWRPSPRASPRAGGASKALCRTSECTSADGGARGSAPLRPGRLTLSSVRLCLIKSVLFSKKFLKANVQLFGSLHLFSLFTFISCASSARSSVASASCAACAFSSSTSSSTTRALAPVPAPPQSARCAQPPSSFAGSHKK